MRVHRMSAFDRDEYKDSLVQNGVIDEDADDEEVRMQVEQDLALADSMQFYPPSSKKPEPNRAEGFEPYSWC